MDNILIPFLLDKTSVRGRIVRLGSVVDDIVKKHNYPTIVNQYLAELISVSASLAGMLDYKGIFTLQTSGDGQIPMMVVDIDHNGNIRSYAKYNEEIAEDTSFDEAMGKGYIAFTVDQGGDTHKYQGLVEIQEGSFEDCIKHYFESSDQIETTIKSFSKETPAGWRAGAIIIQKLPEETNADFTETNIFLQTCMDEELIDTSIEASELLYRLFSELTIRVYDEMTFQAKCRCKRARIEEFLRTLPENEIEQLAEKGKIDVKCEFCSRGYHFKAGDFK